MAKKLLSLGTDGKLVLKLPDGRVEALPDAKPDFHTAFLLVDCSGSMAGNRKLEQAQSGASSFAEDALENGYSIGLIQFASTATVLCKPIRDVSKLRLHINNLTAGGGTNMTQAMQLALEELGLADGVRAIVVVTDGMPAEPASVLNVAKRAKELGIDIIAIGTDDADGDFLKRLASRSELAIRVSTELLSQSIASAAKMLPGLSQ